MIQRLRLLVAQCSSLRVAARPEQKPQGGLYDLTRAQQGSDIAPANRFCLVNRATCADAIHPHAHDWTSYQTCVSTNRSIELSWEMMSVSIASEAHEVMM